MSNFHKNTQPDERSKTKSPPTSAKQQKKPITRTRNGCITCKNRRIKCDEGKPSCAKCTKSNRKCEGYKPKFEFREVPHSRYISPVSSTTSSFSAPAEQTLSLAGASISSTQLAHHQVLPPMASCSFNQYTEPSLSSSVPRTNHASGLPLPRLQDCLEQQRQTAGGSCPPRTPPIPSYANGFRSSSSPSGPTVDGAGAAGVASYSYLSPSPTAAMVPRSKSPSLRNILNFTPSSSPGSADGVPRYYSLG